MKKIAITALCMALCAALSAEVFALGGNDAGPYEVIEEYNVVLDGDCIKTDAGATNERLNSDCIGYLVGNTGSFYFMKDDNGNPVLEVTLFKTGMLIENEAEFMATVAVRGDVTGDGLVDNMDAARMLKYDAGLIPPYTELPRQEGEPPADYDPEAARISFYTEIAGDLTADACVDNMDAAALLKADAALRG